MDSIEVSRGSHDRGKTYGSARICSFLLLELEEIVNRGHFSGSAIALGMRLVDWI